MSVGDVNSTAPGSAARYNDGKPELAQIPMITWAERVWRNEECPMWVRQALWNWHYYQATGRHYYLRDALEVIPNSVLADVSRVLTYGAGKYAQWNWTKGQPWSVPFNSGLRHIAAWLDGEENDEESGLPHLAHFACNVLFVSRFSRTYPEGEDWVAFKLMTEEEICDACS